MLDNIAWFVLSYALMLIAIVIAVELPESKKH